MVRAVIDDYRSAPIPESEIALLAFVEKVNAGGDELTQANVDQLKEHGWTDEALLDAVLVCALFNFYNAMVDGTGVQPLTDHGHRASGRRIARDGYRMP